jgi:agmatine deiminase
MRKTLVPGFSGYSGLGLLLMMALFTLMMGIFSFDAIAQESDALYRFQTRTHMVSPDEMDRMHESGKGFVPTLPPGGKVRSIAEWEPSEGVIVAYSGQFGIPFTVIAQMSQVAKVYTIVANTTTENTVRNQYIANGVNISNCVFVHGPLNSYWSRDYSPWFIADSANKVSIVDFPYNRPRPNDNDVPALFATALGVPMYGMNIKHTGGNYMSDGMGRAASTKLVIAENTNLTLTQINSYMSDYLGIDQYYTLDDPMDDYIDHIDCWGKFLAPDKILLGQVPSNDPKYADYEALATFFANEISSYGTPYKVFRTYSPNGQPYTNSYILNNKVFVPVVTTYGNPWNDSAKAVYERAMPGYDVVGIYALSSKPWASTDALHCRTHEIPDRGMLYIRHIPLHGEIGQKSHYEIRATIIPYSDSALIPDSVFVGYRYNQGPWHKILMIPDTGHQWVGLIPDSAAPAQIHYYIHAADQTGRSENHPYIGAADAHRFAVKSTIGITQTAPLRREVLVYPNPADDRLYAMIPNPDQGSVVVNLYTVAGVRVLSETFSDARRLHREGVGVHHLDNGVYLLEILSAKGRYREKVMIVHQ